MDTLGAYQSESEDEEHQEKPKDDETLESSVLPNVRKPDRANLQAAPIVAITAARFSTALTTTNTKSITNSGTRKRSSANSSELVLMNNPKKSIMYQPIQGPQVPDPAQKRRLVNAGGTTEANVAIDELNFQQQRTSFQRDGIAYSPDGDHCVIRTGLGYTRDRIRTMIQTEKTRPKRIYDTKQTTVLVEGSDDEIEYGVWGPPTLEEQYEKDMQLTQKQKGGIETLAPEQIAEREYIAERNRQKGIEEQKHDEESAYDRMVERKMAHLLPPVTNNNNSSTTNPDGSTTTGPMVPTTTFHGTDGEYDYKGQSWMAPPSGLGSILVDNLPSVYNRYYLDPDHHKCYVPKKCVHRFTGHNNGVHRIRLFPITGHLLLSGGLDGKCKVWSIEKKQVMRTYIGHTAAVRDVQFNHTGTQFLSASFDRYIRLWDTETGKVLQTFTNRKVPYCIQYYPLDDQYFVVGCSDNKIVTYDTKTGLITQEYNHHLGPVNSILFVQESAGSTVKMITSSDDKKVLIWEWDIGVPIKFISDPSMHSMPCLTLHPTNTYFVGQSLDNTIVVLSAGTSNGRYTIQKKKKFTGHVVSGYACEISFSPDGQYITSGDGTGNLFVWDWKKHKLHTKLHAHTNGPTIACLWHPLQPSTLFTAGWDGIIKMWQ